MKRLGGTFSVLVAGLMIVAALLAGIQTSTQVNETTVSVPASDLHTEESNQNDHTETSLMADTDPPEAIIHWDLQTREIIVYGIDDIDPNVDVRSTITDAKPHKMLVSYALADDAGNTLNLTLEHKIRDGNRDVRVLEISYNGASPFVLGENHYKVEFKLEKDTDEISHYHQNIHVRDKFKVNNHYKGSENDTGIRFNLIGQGEGGCEVDGLGLFDLNTDDGELTLVLLIDGLVDYDEDDLTNWDEVSVYGTDPQDEDTDGDGLSDGAEVNDHGTDPLNPDTDGDGLDDYEEVILYLTDPRSNTDFDGDGLSDADEIITYFTNWRNDDTDNDMLSDYVEITTNRGGAGRYTDPANPDTDRDGLTDGNEIRLGVIGLTFDPRKKDTDGDGDSDLFEYFPHTLPPIIHSPGQPFGDGDQDFLPDMLEDIKYHLPHMGQFVQFGGCKYKLPPFWLPYDCLHRNYFDTDRDGIGDGVEVALFNVMATGDPETYQSRLDNGENPWISSGKYNAFGLFNDFDYQGVAHGYEPNIYSSDWDGDGILDGKEVDSDYDGLSDWKETHTQWLYADSPNVGGQYAYSDPRVPTLLIELDVVDNSCVDVKDTSHTQSDWENMIDYAEDIFEDNDYWAPFARGGVGELVDDAIYYPTDFEPDTFETLWYVNDDDEQSGYGYCTIGGSNPNAYTILRNTKDYDEYLHVYLTGNGGGSGIRGTTYNDRDVRESGMIVFDEEIDKLYSVYKSDFNNHSIFDDDLLARTIGHEIGHALFARHDVFPFYYNNLMISSADLETSGSPDMDLWDQQMNGEDDHGGDNTNKTKGAYVFGGIIHAPRFSADSWKQMTPAYKMSVETGSRGIAIDFEGPGGTTYTGSARSEYHSIDGKTYPWLRTIVGSSHLATNWAMNFKLKDLDVNNQIVARSAPAGFLVEDYASDDTLITSGTRTSSSARISDFLLVPDNAKTYFVITGQPLGEATRIHLVYADKTQGVHSMRVTWYNGVPGDTDSKVISLNGGSNGAWGETDLEYYSGYTTPYGFFILEFDTGPGHYPVGLASMYISRDAEV